MSSKKWVVWIFGILLSSQTIWAQPTLRGIITDGKANIAFANVRVYADNQLIMEGSSDSLGRYKLSAPPGVYRLVVHYPSFGKAYSARIEIVEGHTTVHHVMMAAPKVLPEAEIVDFRVPLRDQIMSGKGLIDFNEPPKKPNNPTPKNKN